MDDGTGELPQSRNAARIAREIRSLGVPQRNLYHSYGDCSVVVSAHLSVKQKVEGSIPPNHPNPAHVPRMGLWIINKHKGMAYKLGQPRER